MIKEIEELKKILNNKISENEDFICTDEILNLSHELDEIIEKYIKNGNTHSF